MLHRSAKKTAPREQCVSCQHEEFMTNHNFEQSLLRDALSDVTRKERRSLLGISLFGITLSIGGMVPSKIPSLGIVFRPADQQTLLIIVAVIVFYFIVTFIIYAASDYLSWKLEIKSWAIEKVISESEEVYRNYCPQPGTPDEEVERDIGKLHKKNRFYFRKVAPLSIFRALFDFGFPIVFGAFALFLLVQAVAGNSI